jgi:hypothetical protein
LAGQRLNESAAKKFRKQAKIMALTKVGARGVAAGVKC